MLEALGLQGTERVLEVGTGSGYSAALLAQLARQVFTIERHARLAREAGARTAREGFSGVERGLQRMLRITRHGPARFEEQALLGVHFVPLVGAGGW